MQPAEAGKIDALIQIFRMNPSNIDDDTLKYLMDSMVLYKEHCGEFVFYQMRRAFSSEWTARLRKRWP